ncbi:integrase domain-containing protein [Halomonas sp. G15]|uniref:integrase domain-containing protein n=1 Tax=Halomonas sp. G15 TaxID=2903521 RepID=UPI001E321004|nr:integrase domain-containing protein [Halomonas sp. G15]MCE0734263.1 integrase domain-containing protein [Halomonas sp. G15]
MEFAAKNALRDYYGQGHFETVATHTQRWKPFVDWAREQGVRDLSQIDSRDLATAYAGHVQERVEAGTLAVSTAQNRLSTVNTTFAALRGDRHVKISPSQYAGPRSNVRITAPAALDTDRVQGAIAALQEAGLTRAAVTLELARAFGVRREEAVKADLDRWAREAARHDQHGNSYVNVQEGTKGGRDADRWIPVGEAQRQALANALAARPADSRNLIASHERYVDVAIARSSELNRARAILQQHGLPGYHDSRAAYACARYLQITGHPAPAVAGERLAPKDKDLEARLTISKELGHGRVDVLVSYVGSRR